MGVSIRGFTHCTISQVVRNAIGMLLACHASTRSVFTPTDLPTLLACCRAACSCWCLEHPLRNLQAVASHFEIGNSRQLPSRVTPLGCI
jgi:hypothetical protein